MPSPDRSHLTLVHGAAPRRPSTAPSTRVTRAEMAATAAVAARMCDDLAATAEHGERRAAALLAALERSDLLTLVQCAMELHPILRTLASSLGGLHALVDEIADDEAGDPR